MQTRRFRVYAWVLACLLPVAAHAQSAANVLVVTNEASPASLSVATHYAQTRNIPTQQVLRIKTGTGDEISRTDFELQIQAPITNWLTTNAAQDRILYIVLTKDVPLRIAGPAGRSGSLGSVDSDLTLLYRRMAGVATPANGSVPNPYFAPAGDVQQAKRFTHAAQDVYLVTRLDGFTVADAIALIDRGVAASKPAGRIVLDQTTAATDPRNRWLQEAASRLKAAGFGERLLVDDTARVVQKEPDVLGYAGWGSSDPSMTFRDPDLKFVPGALAVTFSSSDARTFAEPPAVWRPHPGDPRARFRGSSDTLLGDMVRGGITGAAGQVNDPYLDGAVRPEILFPAYLAGFNLAESFYLATPSLSWQSVIVGDPLCAPFRGAPIAASELDPAIDQVTELPAFFSARRVARFASVSQEAAVKQLLRGESRAARGDKAGARAAFERAVQIDGTLAAGWRGIASLEDQAGRYAEANTIYRRLIELDKDDAFSLNNLAYNLAVRENKPQEAREFARRAVQLSGGTPVMADTLGWIEHLLGNDQEAVRLLEQASRALPPNGEILLHAAVVYAAVGRVDDAGKALKAAVVADPALKDRPEYKDTERKISRAP